MPTRKPAGAGGYVARALARAERNFSLTRMQAMFDAVNAAWYLIAVEDDARATALLDRIVAGVHFKGNHNLWSPAANAITLRARLARLAGDESRRATLVARIVEHPAIADMSRGELRSWLAIGSEEIARSRDQASQKWACQVIATGLARLTYFRETAGAGCYYDEWVEPRALDREIAGGLAELRARLVGQPTS